MLNFLKSLASLVIVHSAVGAVETVASVKTQEYLDRRQAKKDNG